MDTTATDRPGRLGEYPADDGTRAPVQQRGRVGVLARGLAEVQELKSMTAATLGALLLASRGGLLPPETTGHLLAALRALEDETVCTNCVRGLCHYGGAAAYDSAAAVTRGQVYVHPVGLTCQCPFHEVSVTCRERRVALRALGLAVQD